MKDIINFCDKTIAETKPETQNIEAKLKASMEREYLLGMKKQQSFYFNKENSRNLTNWNTLWNMIPPSQTRKIKYWQENQTCRLPNHLWGTQHRYKTMNLFEIFRRGPNNERNNSKRITRQGKHAKKGNRYTAEKIEDQYHEIHCKQTNLIMINKYHLSKLTLRQKCPDMEFLLVRIFLYSDCQIGR